MRRSNHLAFSLAALLMATFAHSGWLASGAAAAGQSQAAGQPAAQSATPSPVSSGTPPSASPPTQAQPLSLGECLRIAEEHHPDLATSRALIRQAEYQLQATHSNYLPRLDFGGSYTRQSYNFAASPGSTPTQVKLFQSGESFASAPYYYSGLTLSQTLYDFGRTRGAVERSQAQLEASRRNFDRTRDLVDLNVRSGYFGVLAAEALVRIQAEAVRDQQKHLDQIQAFFEVGTRPKIDVTNQEVALANSQVSLRQAQADLDVARAALATAMGIPIEQSPEPLNTLNQESEPQPIGPLMAEAERNRPDVLAARQQVAAAQADVVAAKGNTKPNLTLASFFDYRNLKFPLVYNWSLAGLLAQNLFSGGLYRAEIGSAGAEVDAAETSLTSLLDQVRQQVFTAYSGLKVSRDKIGLAIQAEAAAKENLELAEGRYQAGYGNIIELTDAQTLYTDSQAQVVTTRFNYQISAAQLDAAVARRPQIP